MRQNPRPDCVSISEDIARHDSNSEDAGSHDSKIDVVPLELYAIKPSINHLHKTTNLKYEPYSGIDTSKKFGK